jgi:type I restriction enzyme S subunit
VKGLPKGWIGAKLGEVCQVVSGSTPRTTVPEYWGDEIPWITPDDLSGYTAKTIARGARSITRHGYDSCSTSLVPAGTVLFTSRAPIGYVAIAAEPVCTNQGFKNFVPSEALLSDYLYWFLKYATPDIRKAGSGTTFPEISKTRAAEFVIPIPPFAEQRRIVAAIEEQFSRLDAGEEMLRALGRRLVALRSSMLLRATEGEWPERPLGTVIKSLRNGIFVSRPGTEPPGTPIFRISAVRPLALDTQDIRFARIDADKASSFFVDEGDLLFTRYSGNPNYVGACVCVPAMSRPTLYPDKLIRAVVDRTVAEPDFLAIALNVGRGRRAIEARRKTTAGQVGIAGSTLREVSIALPPVEAQRRIVSQVQRQLSIIESLASRIGQAKSRSSALRRSILERAFTGRLVPQDPSDEPASVLLERIAAEREAQNAPRKRRRTRRATMAAR